MIRNDASKMTLERATTIIEAYGSSPSRWPEEEQRQLIALLELSPKLQSLAERELSLDKQLDAWQPRESLSITVLMSKLNVDQLRTVRSIWQDWFTPIWQPIAIAILPLAFGFIWGISGNQVVDNWAHTESVLFAPMPEELGNE